MMRTSTGAGSVAYTKCLTIVVKICKYWVRISLTLIRRARNFNTALREKLKRGKRCVSLTLEYYPDQRWKDVSPLPDDSTVIVGARDVWLNSMQ